MKNYLLLLLTLPYIIHTRVLPYGSEETYGPQDHNDIYGTARIDEKKAANVNQDFLNSFLGNVQSSGGSIKPITDQFKEPSKFDTDKFKNEIKKTDKDDGDEFEEPYEDGYDYDYGYGYDDHDDHIDSDYYKYSINCREFHFEEATSAGKCHAVELRDYDPDYDTSKPREKAYCRWDMGFADKNQKQAGCLCPRTKNKCHKKHQCYWYKPKHSKDYESEHDGQCVHNSERFYKILANLLSKRGKKDFALKIKYSSAAAKGELPYGPFGPAYFPYHDEPYTHPILGRKFDFDSFDKPQYGHGSFATKHEQSGYGDYYNDMSLYGDNMPGYGYANGMAGYDDYHGSGYGDYSGMPGYGGYHNGMPGYGSYHNGMAGYNGDPNGAIGYGGYPNDMGGYGGYPAQNNHYAGQYPNINQGVPHEVPYNSEGYNVNPQHAYAPHQTPVGAASESVPYGHVPQNNYVENPVYPAREANSISNQPVNPSVPEYQPVIAPYPSTSHVSGNVPFGQAPPSIPQHLVYQQSPPNTVQVKPVAPEYQAATRPRNEQVYQHVNGAPLHQHYQQPYHNHN